MSNPAFIVEGQQEQLIIQRICPNSKVRRLGVNGDKTSMDAIAKQINALFNVFGNKNHPVIVIFDREKRKQTCNELEDDLLKKMKKLNLPIDQFIISIVDRKFESWIVPFIAEDGTMLSEPIESADGFTGHSELIRRLKRAGIDYHKTTNGVDLFCSISPKALSKISPSFHKLSTSVRSHCRWIESF